MATSRPAPEPGTLAITGIGMVSTLGLGAIASCAAARAGILRASDLGDGLGWNEDAGEVEGTRGHEVATLTRGFVGVGRLVRLGTAALQDILASVDLGPPLRLGMVINLGSSFHFGKQFDADPGEPPLDPEFEARRSGELSLRRSLAETHVIARLLSSTGLVVAPTARRTLFEDEAGLVPALLEAKRWLDAGTIDACIVGGIDSQIDPEILHAMHSLGIVKTASQPVGRMPGEAAAMVLVESATTSARRSRPVAGVVGGLTVETEPRDRFATDAHVGDALFRAAALALGAVPPAAKPVDRVIADLTGEGFRAEEWGHAQVRLRARKLVETWSECYPALHFGAIGAATGPVALCMACRGFARGYGPGRSALVWLLSDSGARGALWVGRADS